MSSSVYSLLFFLLTDSFLLLISNVLKILFKPNWIIICHALILNKVFKEDAKIKNSVFFSKTLRTTYTDEEKGEYGRYSFYADRYDYLRIAKSIMDHWNNDTCVGKYLKTIYEQRINKNKKSYNGDRSGQFDVAMYTKKYGGQFHFNIIGLSKRKILGMSGFGGQNITIDFENNKIIAILSIHRDHNWMKLVHSKF